MSEFLFSVGRGSPTLVVGLGNPLLGDDGFGWRAAEQIRQQVELADCSVEVDCLAVGGLSLMERLIGYQHVILIDAIFTGQWPVGSIHRLTLDDLPDQAAGHLSSAHDTTLPTAFRVGRALGMPLPDNVAIVAVEAANSFDFVEELTPLVAAAVPLVTRMVVEMLQQASWKE
jgi:hydrogenase maturation protease